MVALCMIMSFVIQDRRPAGVFCLQNRETHEVYWGTAWDLYAVRNEQMEMVEEGTHPCEAMRVRNIRRGQHHYGS